MKRCGRCLRPARTPSPPELPVPSGWPIGISWCLAGARKRRSSVAPPLIPPQFPTVRFDYHGIGDSAGAHDDPARLREWIASVGDAIAFARANSSAKHVALMGVGIGATLALAAATQRHFARISPR